MEALILAAGLGSRLRPHTLKHPKAMIKYDGIEIITNQINALHNEGISKIIVVTGYKSEQLKQFLKKNYKNIQIINNKEYESSNSAYSFMKGFSSLKSESYIHLNCDILFSKKLLSNVINQSDKNVIAVRDDLVFNSAMENVISVDNRIVNMSLRYSKQTSYKAYGLAKISNEALQENIINYQKLIPEVQRKENYYGLIRMSLGNHDYHICRSDKYNLAEINTVDDLKRCQFNSD